MTHKLCNYALYLSTQHGPIDEPMLVFRFPSKVVDNPGDAAPTGAVGINNKRFGVDKVQRSYRKINIMNIQRNYSMYVAPVLLRGQTFPNDRRFPLQ